MIKVAFIAEILERNYDGATRTMFQIIDRIDRSKFEYMFLCGVASKEDIPHKVSQLSTLQIPFNKKYRFVNPYVQLRKIKQLLEDFRPDVIHIASPSLFGQIVIKFAKRKKIPVLSIYHTHFKSYVEYYTQGHSLFTSLGEAYVQYKTKKFYNGCNYILVPTKSIKKELIAYGIQKKKLKIWARGVDTALFNPVKRDELFIESITNNSWPNLLFASRLVWEKNLKILVNIYNRSKQFNLNYNFIIAGDGVARKKLEKLMPEAHFLGHLNHQDLSKVYASSDYFIFPSTSETYGNVLLEAMASGLPCIVAEGGASLDIIRQGINGFVCQIGNADDYLKKVNLLLKQPTIRKLIQQEGIRFAGSNSWDSIVEEYFNRILKLYRKTDTSVELNDEKYLPNRNFETVIS